MRFDFNPRPGDEARYPKEGTVKWKAKFLAAVGYCVTHRKQLASAVAFGAALLEAVQKTHG